MSFWTRVWCPFPRPGEEKPESREKRLARPGAVLFKRRMNSRRRADFFFELSKLLQAGIPVARSLGVLERNWRRGVLGRWAGEWALKLGENRPIAEAFAALPHAKPLEVALIEAGERGGRLAYIVAQLADYYSRVGQSEDRVRRACLYPVILAHLIAFLEVVPRAFSEVGSAWMFAFGGRVLLLWAALGAVLGVLTLVPGGAGYSPGVDRIWSGVPGVRAVRRAWVLARFASVFETGLLAGLRVSETLGLAAAASGSALVAAAARKAAGVLASGGTLAESLAQSGGFPPDFVACIGTAEIAGSLDLEFKRLAEDQRHKAERALQALEEWAPRGVYAVVSLWMVYRIFAQFLAYTGQLGALSNGLEG